MQHQGQDNTQNTSSLTSNPFIEGKWLPEEHQAFLQGITIYNNDWHMISDLVQTRSPSQVRSHAQKYYNKLNNDRQKIGKQQKIQLLGKTRFITKTQNISEQEKNPAQSPATPTTPVQIPEVVRKIQKKRQGSSFRRINPKQEAEIRTLAYNQQGLDTQISEPSEQSFFMERIFPKLGSCPLKEFSVFTLIELERCRGSSEMETASKRGRKRFK